MKKILLILCLTPLFYSLAMAQCDVRFGTSDGRFIFADVETGESGIQTVTAGATEVLTFTSSHNLWNEDAGDCNLVPAGLDDVTIVQTLNNTNPPTDIYGGLDLAGDASDKMNITQNASGLSGTSTHGSLSSSKSSTGDVRSYTIEVTFANHIVIQAKDLTVKLSSVNTAGEAFESASLIFKGAGGTPYGTASYNGFWVDPDGLGGEHPGVVTECPPSSPPTINSTIYTTTGTGVYTIAETGTMNLADHCNPVAGTSGTENTKDVNAETDALLAPTDQVTGFIFHVNLENVATALADGTDNGTRTLFTSRLTGFDYAATALPVELTHFDAKPQVNNVALTWSTASELNNDYFVVETSKDAHDYYPLEIVQGMGTSHTTNHYQYLHKNAGAGTHYYRLKQVDFDRAYEYSNIAVAKISKKEGVLLMPTAAREQVSIVLPKNYEDASYRLIDIKGEVLDVGLLTNERMDLDISDLSEGMYFISIVYGREIEFLKFFKTENQ